MFYLNYRRRQCSYTFICIHVQSA